MNLLRIDIQGRMVSSSYIASRLAPYVPSLKSDEVDVPDRFAAERWLTTDRPGLPDIDMQVYLHTS